MPVTLHVSPCTVCVGQQLLHHSSWPGTCFRCLCPHGCWCHLCACACCVAAEYMRSIKAMEMDALDPEIIAAARARRSRERWVHRTDCVPAGSCSQLSAGQHRCQLRCCAVCAAFCMVWIAGRTASARMASAYDTHNRSPAPT